MAGKKTTTVTNILRTNATDAKRFMRLCGQHVAESDKLHILTYDVYGIEDNGDMVNIGMGYSRFALVPSTVLVEQAATAYTAADAREFALLNRLIDAGIASNEETERFNVLAAKESGDTTNTTYIGDDVTGKNINTTDDVGKLLTTLTLS